PGPPGGAPPRLCPGRPARGTFLSPRPRTAAVRPPDPSGRGGASPPARSGRDRPMSPQAPARILLVDDDATNRQALGWCFRNNGFATLEASTGAEALRLAQTRPDLAVLDVSLPDVSGFEVCRRIKGNTATAGVLVVHLSGRFVGSGDRAQG